MSKKKESLINNKYIIASRGEKNRVDPRLPYAWMVEKERTSEGEIEGTGIIFLTNKECPFRCLMCDLWKNTTNESVPVGAIPEQIKWALSKMPKVKHLKLYNSGNFFDPNAIPVKDYEVIATLLSNFETVIVESHPKFINEKCLHFKELLKPKLEIAIGLEIANPKILQELNKQMTLEEFKKSIKFLTTNGIQTRAFILLKSPFLSEVEGVYWAKKSLDFAYNAGVECCTLIPVRLGNGIMDLLVEKGDFSLPNIHSLEAVLEYGIGLNKGRTFADVWDLSLFSKCDKCLVERIDRLTEMNLNQQITNRVLCNCKTTET
jgi:radical SAM enzyme (TIGR01210 family)